jgi:uncharacterized protein YndB with AHSA1/START domain
MTSASLDPVRCQVTVPLGREAAFELLTARIGEWWPRVSTFSRRSLASVHIDPTVGRWYERSTDGDELSWGRILVWQPPGHLALSWQITADGKPEPNPNRASRVEIRLFDDDGRTRVELEHSAFERHGREGGRIWRDGMAGPKGWQAILAPFVAAAERGR